MALLPCSSCNRHVHLEDTACPFCGAALGAREAAPAPSIRAGLSRGARYAIGGASLVASAVACNTESIQPVYGAPVTPRDGGADSGLDVPRPLYGAPANPLPDAGRDGGDGGDGGNDGGGVQPAYGGPPH